MFEKNLNIVFLLDFYGDVLSERSRDVLEMYYFDDMSLSEIADSMAISRQGARHIIKKGEEDLLLWEERMGLAHRFNAMKEAAAELEALSRELVANANTDKEKALALKVAACAAAILEKNRE